MESKSEPNSPMKPLKTKKEMLTMLTQKMQETIHRFKKKHTTVLTEEEALQKSRGHLLNPLVESLILARLCQSDSYGYEIAQSVKQSSGGRLCIPEGSMYPTLYRMMERGYITDYQTNVGKRRLRVYYQITPAGRMRFKALLEAYEETHAGYENCLAAMGGPLPTQAENF